MFPQALRAVTLPEKTGWRGFQAMTVASRTSRRIKQVE